MLPPVARNAVELSACCCNTFKARQLRHHGNEQWRFSIGRPAKPRGRNGPRQTPEKYAPCEVLTKLNEIECWDPGVPYAARTGFSKERAARYLSAQSDVNRNI